MSSDINDLTVQYEEDGVVTVKELDKVILSKGAWSTIIYRYQDWDRQKNSMAPTNSPFGAIRSAAASTCRNPSSIFPAATRRAASLRRWKTG